MHFRLRWTQNVSPQWDLSQWDQHAELRQTNEVSRTSAADTGFNPPYAGAGWLQPGPRNNTNMRLFVSREMDAGKKISGVLFVMRIGLFSALLIAVALTAGVALGFLAEQTTQPSPSTQSSDSTQRLAEPVLTPPGTYGDRL